MSHRRSTCMLYLLAFLISSVNAFDITANVTVEQDEGGNYFILINEGDSIQLTCENFQATHFWVLPDNSELLNFDKDDRDARIKTSVGHDEAEQLLTISNAKVIDTGLYGCKYDRTVEADVYVYVKGPTFFLKSSIKGLQVENNFTIPCRGSWPPLEEEGPVELYAEQELWKEATKAYDPKVGFVITPKLMKQKLGNQGIAFECRFKDESVRTYIQQKSKNNKNVFKLSFHEETEFPYAGGSYNYSCIVAGKNIYDVNQRFFHRINTDCPRCESREDMHFKSVHSSMDELVNQTVVNNLTTQDSGTYSCVWFMEQENGFVQVDEIKRHVSVSATIEQIKLINRTSARPSGFVEIKEGALFNLTATLRVFPDDRSIYKSKWERFFVRAQKGTIETETLINDNRVAVGTEQTGRDIIETLTIRDPTVADSGVYTLTIDVNGVKRAFDWKVHVESRGLNPVITVASPDSWILFDQKYYNVGSYLRVFCVVEGIPKPEVFLSKRNLDPMSGWEEITNAVAIEGTYSVGYALNVTAKEDVEFRCEGRSASGNMRKADTTKILVTDQQTEIATTWSKPEQATDTEDSEVIYEGDQVNLECIAPRNELVSLQWVNGMGFNLPLREEVVSHSKHLIATINNASAGHTGDYTCIVKDGSGLTKNFTRTIEIAKIVKPFEKQTEEPSTRTVNYEAAEDLKCEMSGSPKPIYKWSKDGEEITDQLFDNGMRLHIPRAARQDEGQYVCTAVNRAGKTEKKFSIKVKGAPQHLSGMQILAIVLIFLLLLGCLIAAFILYTRQRKTSKQQAKSLQVLYEQLMRGGDSSEAPPLPMHGKVTMDMRVKRTAYDPKYEIERNHLVLLEALGSGQFGSVRKGRVARGATVSDSAAYRGPALTVAVKTPRNGSNPEDQKALIDELKILIAIDNLEEGSHPNVLTLVGAVTKNMKDGQLFVVFEMCENGDLKTYLQKYRNELKDKFWNEIKEVAPTASDDYLVPNNQVTMKYLTEIHIDEHTDQERDRLLGDPKALTTSDLISFSMQIASGMSYLASVSCIHRDLAARNCLLTANKVVKIADFGMAKNEQKGYYRMNKTNVMVPYRWMALESMDDHMFTIESDVWSYGIVLYEIFSLGAQPYPAVPNNSLHEHLKSGQRNPRPDQCHIDIYNLMLRTWDKEPHRRPDFAECYHFMRDQLSLASAQVLASTDAAIQQNAAQIAQFDQFRGPGATVELDDSELAALLNGQAEPVSPSSNNDNERIYIKELRR